MRNVEKSKQILENKIPAQNESEAYGRVISLQDFLEVSRMLFSSKDFFHNLKLNLHLEAN